MKLSNKDIENILYNHFEDISKYLKYDDYYKFYQLYAPKKIEILKRKCIYCNRIPTCPINICYKKNNKKLRCNKSLINPVCYSCAIDNWVHNFNTLNLKNKLNNGFICPHKCCKFKKNDNLNILINRRDEDLFCFDNSWNYLKKIHNYKCPYCNFSFNNKYNYDIYKHFKTSTCRIIIKKIKSGLNQFYSDSDSNSDSEYESDY